MASNASEPSSPQPGNLQSMLARLRGMVQALKMAEADEAQESELLPGWDTAEEPVRAPAVPPVAEFIEPPPGDGATTEAPPAPAATEQPPAAAGGLVALPEEAPSAGQLCPFCQAPRRGEETYCENCGWIFAQAEPSAAPPLAPTLLQGRYELGQRLGVRGEVERYRGLDHQGEHLDPVPVILLRAPLPQVAEAVPDRSATPAAAEATPSAEESPAQPESPAAPEVPAETPETATQDLPPASPGLEAVAVEPAWPSIAWEQRLLERAPHPALPRVLAHFAADGYEYLVEEQPAGQPLWDAWDDPEATAAQRFGWLSQVALALEGLHEGGAILEGLRPDIVITTPDGRARLSDLGDLLPLPLPPDPPIRATYYTAPELVLDSGQADARSDLYSFGAMLYALHLGRELTDLDFELQGVPKAFLERFPDAHPLFARLVSKTFCRDPQQRFPTEETAASDPTGFGELLQTLAICGRVLDTVRLDIAAWTTTGMVRTGNEDAFALLHAVESRENDLGEAVLVLLADGMGGSAAGEVAAALAIQAMRKYLVQQKPFAALAGSSVLAPDAAGPAGPGQGPMDVEICKLFVSAALREANQQVHAAAQEGSSQDGMGCTAELVYVDGRHVVVGHVGDSRTYHLHAGKLVLLTRDQTWVNRMVELGVLSQQEADQHPRRSELQQAIGGHPDVEPALAAARLQPGDWVVVCSDGVTNHIPADTLKELLQRATCAEAAARRLINLVNQEGATDNATVVVLRAT